MSREDTIEVIAREFHHAYGRIAFQDNPKRKKPIADWTLISERDRNVMKATIRSLITDGFIVEGPNA
jgi:hypothetical protein